jgi:ATP-binding cassette subfamily B protein
MPNFHLKGAPTSDPTSGITEIPEFADPAGGDRDRPNLRGRVRAARQAVVGTIAATPQVLSMVWRASPWLTIGLALGAIVAGLFPAATAVIARLLINAVAHAMRVHGEGLPDEGVIGPVAGFALHTTATGAIAGIVAIQFVVFLLTAMSGALRAVATELLQQQVTHDVQLGVIEHAARMELSFFEDARSYDLIRQAQEEASVRPVTMIENVYGLLQSAITFGSVIALLIALNPWVALAALLAPVPAFLADARFGKMAFLVSMWSSPIRRRMDYLSRLVTTDTYAKEVKLFGLGPYFTSRFRALGQVFYRRLRRQVATRSLVTTGLSALTTLVTSLAYLYIAMEAVSGRRSLGDLVMYTAVAATLQTSVHTLFQEMAGMYENNLYLDNMRELLSRRPAIVRPAAPARLPDPVRGHIVFEHVTFRYPGAERPALRDVCFELAPGRTLAVVGRNGAGKSTLVKLACRLYDPDQGRILLDGVDLRDLDPDELRSHISATFQDYVTYQATVTENIGLGDHDHIRDRARVEAAAVKGGAHDLVLGLPDGYDTGLGKWFAQGVELSGGEWQKIALSRAFMRDAPILVFDEPTSALDPVSEHELFTRLRALAEGRSTIYVSHRFSTVRQADRILFLLDGAVTEEGTHVELMDLGQDYAGLFRTQASAYVDVPVAAPPAR